MNLHKPRNSARAMLTSGRGQLSQFGMGDFQGQFNYVCSMIFEISITNWRQYCVQNVTKTESNGHARVK